MTYVVDTHALIWFLERSTRLGAQAAAALRDDAARLVVPAIVLAEVKYLADRGRVETTLERVMRAVSEDVRSRIYPIDEDVVQAMPSFLDINESTI
jgi:PIN domain nuclease of toxin-antitoxin system